MKKYILYAVMCLIWGTTWMFIKIGLDDLTPFFSLGIRYLAAGAVLGGYLLITERKIEFEKQHFKLIIYITFLNFLIPYSLVYWAEQHIYSDLTCVIFAMMPVNVTVLSLIFVKTEKYSLQDYGGILIGFTGILLIFSESAFSGKGLHIYGMLAVFISSFLGAVITIILKKYKNYYHPLKINFFPVLFTGIIVTLFSLLTENVYENRITVSGTFSIFYLAVFGTVIAFGIFYWLVHRIKLTLLSANALITPIIAIISGWIILDEKLNFIQIFGALLVLTGVFLTARRKKIHTDT